MKRVIAMLLCICMLLSVAACGAPAKKSAQKQPEAPKPQSAQVEKPTGEVTEELSREDKELVAELIGGKENASEMTNEELDIVVNEAVGQVEKEEKPQFVDLSNKPAEDKQGATAVQPEKPVKEDVPTVDLSDKLTEENYDENGAMTKPFDQVFPELIEQEQVKFSGESILIKMKSDTLTDGLKAAGVGALEKIVPMEKYAWYEAKLTEGTDAQKALEAVRQLKEVLLAEYNYEVQTAALDDYKHFDKEQDEDFKKNGHNKDQWHFHHCGIPDGYDEMETEGGTPSVIVAVIDSGVDYTHEDLKDNMWVNAKEIPDNGRDDDGNGYVDDYYGVDIISKKGNGGDTNGHGTHVAGIIAARNNNVGVMGIAYNVKIMSVKAAMHNGTLNQADIAKAVLYAYEHGAEVINMSFGGTACSIAVQDALATAYTRCVLVASAGNNGAPNEGLIAIPNYPAALTYVLGVMSVDETGRESVFTNYDVLPFNGVEYELYAPGENIMSTLPGNKYGYLSGTSMAAPMVSAFAAILRSEFSDRDKYPTKFIYGQLASTSQIHADCLDPELHGPHNLPQVVDLNAALTKLPKPEVNLQDYALFDDPKYSKKNNGDGVIDAGETIALGLTLRNRWGMSENTLVTIDTLSTAGLSDPYITIKNPTVNYGSVGTYSTQDCGKVFTDELLTGWEDPFLITIAEDCPNDYRFTLNVTISCENALDEADETTYVTDGKVNENVRSGCILPSVIEEDMVLTKDQLYIIPNATIIQEGVTVKVMPGTHIQFWSDDPNDPYADTYIAYLLVNGKFLVEGTKEEPVYIYPSQLMDIYGVEIGSSSKGYVSLKYADVTNFMYYNSSSGDHTGTDNRIDLADHCTFRNNYGTYLYYRYLESGVVRTNANSNATIGHLNAKDCVFYKLGLYSYEYLHGTFDRCIFSQCGIRYNSSSSDDNIYRNCVFLGNTLVDQTDPGDYNTSSITVYSDAFPSADSADTRYYNVWYWPETGTTYVTCKYGDEQYAESLREAFGAEYLKIETAAENKWLRQKEGSVNGGCFNAKISWDKNLGSYAWADGTPLDPALFPNATKYTGKTGTSLKIEYGKFVSDGSGWAADVAVLEIPGPILPTDITFNQYTVDMDLETVYQLVPQNTPVQLPANSFLYESADESVITVSNTGLVTPVGKGTADVWVWSLDKAVKNRVTFTVRDCVALESLAFPVKTLKLEMGKSVYAPCVLTPADTTRRNVSYTSSDPSVVTVDNGLLTPVGKGTATITATCEGMTATMQVTTWVRATSLTYQAFGYTRTMESMDASLPEPVVSPANADLDLEWTSDNPSMLSVEDGKLVMKTSGETSLRVTDKNSGLTTSFRFELTSTPPRIQADPVIAVQPGAEPVALPPVTMAAGAEAAPQWQVLDSAVAEVKDGKIIIKGTGLTTLRVTDPRNGLTDSISLHVTAEALPKVKELQTDRNEGTYAYALLEDGRLFCWYTDSTALGMPTLVAEGVKVFDAFGSSAVVLLEDNTVAMYNGTTLRTTYTGLPEGAYKDVVGYYSYDSGYYAYVLAEDGSVYALGNNNYGQLGIGTTANVAEFTKVQLSAPVKQIAYNASTAYYLTESGDLYISGSASLKMTVPVVIARNVTWLDNGGKYYVTNDHLAYFDGTEPVVREASLAGYTMLDVRSYNGYFNGMALKDDKIYRVYADGTLVAAPALNQNSTITAGSIASACYYNSYPVYYALTEDGMVFASGYGYYDGKKTNAFLGLTAKGSLSADDALYLPIVYSVGDLKVEQTNLAANGVLSADALQLQMNKDLLSASATIYENGTPMIAKVEFKDNHLRITPSVGFAEGAAYKLVITTANIRGTGMAAPAEDIVIEFTYNAPEVEQPEETTPEEIPEATLPDVPQEDKVVYEAIVDESVVRYWTWKSLNEALADWIEETQYHPNFSGNAILNPISTDTNVEHWLRPLAPSVSAGYYKEIPLGGNYWGSTNERAIELQMIDYTDFVTYARLMYAPYLTEAPENTFPFVTSVKLFNKYGEEVTTVGNEEVTFQVKFNRDMDTSIPLLVRFGSAFPYGDYEVAGQYVDARTWEGKYTLNTLIENGNQFFTISNGCSATDDLELQIDQHRFGFVIDTTAAQALVMQGTASDTGIELKWTQDDFKTLMGYNVYRSTKEDGLYTRLNATVIPADTMEWFDDTVEPGVVYYYNFTVVQTDMTESEPSGKIVIMSKDTMAPNIYHSPVSGAFSGTNLVLSATITDNLNIAYANLYYRVAGTAEWKIIRMNKLNDKYSAIIPAEYMTVAGLEYYIEAFDGVSFTYKGSEDAPYTIAVQEAVDTNALGDVDGDGVITNLDALLLLYTINDKYNMTAEEFARADLNGDGELWAAEALRILQYVSGVVGSVKM